ncbi:Bacterial sec-independent translocation protein, partial [Candidatus Magnetoovum chiemensis]
MFDLALQELAVIFVVALIVVGPKNLPELGKKIGKTIAYFRAAFYEVKNNITRELDTANSPLENNMDDIRKQIEKVR